MTRITSSAAFTAYFVTYAAGFAALMYLARRLPPAGIMLWLPFALPAILLVILAIAAHAEEQEPLREQEHTPLLGKAFGRIAPPLRTYPIVAVSMANPMYSWMYPASVSSQLRSVFDAWWVTCALLAWIVVPRIFSAENAQPLNPRIPDH